MKINREDWSFVGKSGKKYKACEYITAGRWSQFEVERVAVTLGMRADDLYDRLFSVYNQLEGGAPKVATASVKLWNIMSAIKSEDERKSPIVRLAAIICNEEDEVQDTLTEEQIQKKVDDFALIDIHDFFFLVLNFMPTLPKNLEGFLAWEKEMEQQ